jgi:hypothetical protein
MSEVLSQTRTTHRQNESGPGGNCSTGPADNFADNQVTPGANNAARDLPADLRSQIKPFRP